MAAPMDLVAAKKNLADALGDGMKLYLQILRQWFKTKLSREDFDHEARKLMSPETVHLHNQFLLCIIVKCQASGSALVKESPSSHSSQSKPGARRYKRRKSHHHGSQSSKTSFSQRFIAADPLTVAPQIQPHIPEPEERGPGYVSREMVLPDLGMIQGRLLVSAWDYGLDDVQDDAAKMLLCAVEHQLKNVITAILSRRHGYKVRDGRFRHAMGSQVPPPHLRNTLLARHNTTECSEPTSVTAKGVHMPSVRPSIETAERDAAVHLALSQADYISRGPVSLHDCFEALQCNKSAIPSHTVYTNCMERIIHRLWHPSTEELEAHRSLVQKTSSSTDRSSGWRMLTAKT